MPKRIFYQAHRFELTRLSEEALELPPAPNGFQRIEAMKEVERGDLVKIYLITG